MNLPSSAFAGDLLRQVRCLLPSHFAAHFVGSAAAAPATQPAQSCACASCLHFRLAQVTRSFTLDACYFVTCLAQPAGTIHGRGVGGRLRPRPRGAACRDLQRRQVQEQKAEGGRGAACREARAGGGARKAGGSEEVAEVAVAAIAGSARQWCGDGMIAQPEGDEQAARHMVCSSSQCHPCLSTSCSGRRDDGIEIAAACR